MSRSIVVGVLLCLLLVGCRDRAANSPTPPARTTAVANPTDQWLGRWNGPEGTYLQISKTSAKYLIEIRDLDGSKTFEGYAHGERIAFQRDGKEEFLSAGDGRATGMKWLLDKKNCLLTRTGEGWCRNGPSATQ